MAEIAGEAVGNVDRGVRQAAQPLAELDARLGLMQPSGGLGDLGMRETKGRAAELARHPDLVAGARAGAIERHARRHLAHRGDGDRALRRARRVAADQVDAETLGEREEPRGERLQPGLIGLRQADREQRPLRRRAHRREVGQVDGERLVTERARLGIGREVPPFDQHVGGDRELEAGVRAQQGAVVADPDQRALALRRPLEVTADEVELVQVIRDRDLATSSGRSALAIFSSTPLTKR